MRRIVLLICVQVALVAIPAATPIVDAIRGYTLSYPRGPSDPPHWSRPASLTLMYAALFWILCKLCCCEKKAKSVYADYLAPRDGNIELNSQHDRSFRRVRSPISQDQLCRGTAAEHYHFQESYLTRFGRSISSVLGGPSNSHEESPVEFATRQYTDRGSSNYQDSSIPTSHRRSGPTRTDGAGQPKGATRPTSGEGIPQPMLPPHTPPELSSHASGDSSSIATYAGSFVHPVHRDSLRSVATPHRELLGSSHSSPFSLDIQPKPDPTSPNLSDADNEVFEPNADFTAPLCPLPTMLRTSGSVQGVPRQSPPEVYLPTRPRSGSLPSLPSSPMLSSSLRHARSREESGTQRGLTVMESYDISADTLQGRGRQGRMVLSRVSEGEED